LLRCISAYVVSRTFWAVARMFQMIDMWLLGCTGWLQSVFWVVAKGGSRWLPGCTGWLPGCTGWLPGCTGWLPGCTGWLPGDSGWLLGCFGVSRVPVIWSVGVYGMFLHLFNGPAGASDLLVTPQLSLSGDQFLISVVNARCSAVTLCFPLFPLLTRAFLRDSPYGRFCSSSRLNQTHIRAA